MVIFDSTGPVYNTIIFYILIICLILIIKPSFMYCDKTGKFKAFGLENDQTIFSFPFVAIGSGITLYLIFLLFWILCNYLDER